MRRRMSAGFVGGASDTSDPILTCRAKPFPEGTVPPRESPAPHAGLTAPSTAMKLAPAAQFSEGTLSAESTTTTSTGSLRDSSLSPSFSSDALIDTPDGSDASSPAGVVLIAMPLDRAALRTSSPDTSSETSYAPDSSVMSTRGSSQ